MFQKFILFIALLHSTLLYSLSSCFSCTTDKNNLDEGVKDCWEQLQKQWHINVSEYPAILLKSAIIDYSYKNQKVSIRFNKKLLLESLLKEDIAFTGDLNLQLILVHTDHQVISKTQDKFILDIGKALIEKCSWSTLTPNFDLSEIFLKGSHLAPPLSTKLLDLPKKYNAFGFVALEMDNQHNINLYFIGPNHTHDIHFIPLTTTAALKSWLDDLIPKSFYITKDVYRSTLSFSKPYWSYPKVITLLENQVEIKDFHLAEITLESIIMNVDFYLMPERVAHWTSYYRDLNLIQEAGTHHVKNK